MNNSESNNLYLLLRIIAQELKETLFWDVASRSMFGLLFKGGLQMALGPFGFAIPIADLATFTAKVSFKSYKAIQDFSPSGVAYDISTSSDRILSASLSKNIDPRVLYNLPLQLPRYYDTPIHKLYESGDDFIDKIRVSRIDASRIFQPIYQLYPLDNTYLSTQRYICPECKRMVSGSDITTRGHSAQCTRNPKRDEEWCDKCKTDLTKNSHHKKCPTRCKECGGVLTPIKPSQQTNTQSAPNTLAIFNELYNVQIKENTLTQSALNTPAIFNELYNVQDKKNTPSSILNKLLWGTSQLSEYDLWSKRKGHRVSCSQNPSRSLEWCDECKKELSPPWEAWPQKITNQTNSSTLNSVLEVSIESENKNYTNSFIGWLNDQLPYILGGSESINYLRNHHLFRQLWHASKCSKNPLREKKTSIRDMIWCASCKSELIWSHHKNGCRRK